jgi:polyhydroxybutyrate depolymerase
MISRRHLRIAVAVLGVLGGACSSSSESSKGSSGGSGSGAGGTSSTAGTASGGVTGSGGSPSTTATGGRVGSGGSVASGGATATGGSQSSGGANITGGVTNTGGHVGSGGALSGGGSGSQGTGGKTGTGGSTIIDAGRDGSPMGGSTSMDARPDTAGVADTAVDKPGGATDAGGTSPGCGSAKTTSSCSKSGGTKCTLTSNSKTREYYLILPATYNPSKPYPVVIMLHGMIATAEMALSWFKEIPTNMPDAIYIAPQGLKHAETGGGANGQEVTGWANVNGEDIQFMKDLLGAAQNDYCVDTQRAFAVGFSYGAMFSYAIGCELGGTFRAIAPMSGALLSGCNLSGKPVAMWGSHGTNDSLVPIATGRQARDKILQQNHCGTQTSPVDPSPCVAYQGCDDGYPVTWCEWDGDHNRPSFGNAAVAAFFKQF